MDKEHLTKIIQLLESIDGKLNAIESHTSSISSETNLLDSRLYSIEYDVSEIKNKIINK